MSADTLTLEQKFAKFMLDLRALRPFYAAIYENIDKIERSDINTAAVDIKNMYYNKKYLESLPYAEFMFVILHEITHIALMHVARIEDRDVTAWNYCTDFIVNHILIKEFGLDRTCNTAVNGIKIPRGALVMDLSDDDSAEMLYHRFMERTDDDRQKAYSRYQVGAGGSSQGSFQSPDSEENSGGTHEDTSETKDTNNEGKNNTQSDLSETDDTKDGDNESEIGASGETKDTDKSEGSNSGEKSDNNTNSDGNKNGDDTDEQQLQGPQYAFTDLINKRSVSDELDVEHVKGILESAAIREKMEGAYSEKGSLLGTITSELLKSKNDWIKMLKKHCLKLRSTDTTFKQPDKRMYYQSAIYPGTFIDDSDVLDGVELCIDTSGSMSVSDIGYVLGQIDDICRKYKVNYEALCWDTQVCTLTSGNDIDSIIENELTGRGGTDPMCIFDYMQENNKKPNVIIIFTDGGFNTIPLTGINGKKLAKKYKNVIWVMTRKYNRHFKPTIGKLAFAKFPE